MQADALLEPDQVWAALEWNARDRRVTARRCDLARFRVGRRVEAVLAAFE